MMNTNLTATVAAALEPLLVESRVLSIKLDRAHYNGDAAAVAALTAEQDALTIKITAAHAL